MRIPGWLFLFGLIVFVGLTALTAVVAFGIARQAAIDLGNVTKLDNDPLNAFISARPTATPTTEAVVIVATPTIAPTLAPGETPQPTATPDPLAAYQWNDSRRITLLLMGIDQRSGGEQETAYRTDTIILVQIDPVSKKAGVLSIPRDLWVNIPGFLSGRINTANSLGDTSAYPGGGPALLAETIRQLLGIRIDKYIRVNFDVFTAVVNAVSPNGTQICVEQTIDDPHYPDAGYGIIPVHFDTGCQTLNAERLLQYARTRATAGSDFDRAKRQQEVLRALREQVLSAGGVVQFIGQAPMLWSQVSQSIKTNLTLDEIIQLGVLMGDIPKDSIRFGQIDNLYVDLTTTTSGEQVLVPRPSAIRLLLQQVFNSQEELSLADLKTRADAEKANVVVFNNTDIAGIAGQTRDWLTAKGVSILEIGNTPAPTNTNTVIHVYTDKIWTARYLAALMGLPPEVIKPGADGLTTKDVAIIVGPDIQPIISGTGG